MYSLDEGSDTNVQLQMTKALLREIGENVSNNSQNLSPYFPHINAMLTNVLKCKLAGSEETCSDLSDFSTKQFIAPGKCNKHQWRFQKTSRTPGRKKNPSILRLIRLVTNYKAYN